MVSDTLHGYPLKKETFSQEKTVALDRVTMNQTRTTVSVTENCKIMLPPISFTTAPFKKKVSRDWNPPRTASANLGYTGKASPTESA